MNFRGRLDHKVQEEIFFFLGIIFFSLNFSEPFRQTKRLTVS